MSIAKKSLKEFVLTAQNSSLEYNTDTKDRWHRLGKRIAKVLAEYMGLKPSEYGIKSDKETIRTSGNITLTTDTLHIQLSISGFDSAIGFLYRRHGEHNQFMKWDELLDLEAAALKIQQRVK